jgi:serine/threonine protein kinase
LGRYVLLQKLASGGMGDVFIGSKQGPAGIGPRVALKVLRAEMASDPQFIEMLVDEANISMFLNHQNVVSVLDLAEADGTYFLAMEYVPGVTAQRLVDEMVARSAPMDVPLALFIATEVAKALKYAHSRVDHEGRPLGIIHRDVTPANVLLSVEGEVKLTDFGIARARNRLHQTQAGLLKGKFGYMAPEMIRTHRLDQRADVFCAGVTTYLLLTGHHPAANCTVLEGIERFERREVRPPSDHNPAVPRELDRVILRAMEPDPERRWSSASDMLEALQDVLLSRADWRAPSGGARLVAALRTFAPDAFQDPHPDSAPAADPTDPSVEAQVGATEEDDDIDDRTYVDVGPEDRTLAGTSAVGGPGAVAGAEASAAAPTFEPLPAVPPPDRHGSRPPLRPVSPARAETLPADDPPSPIRHRDRPDSARPSVAAVVQQPARAQPRSGPSAGPSVGPPTDDDWSDEAAAQRLLATRGTPVRSPPESESRPERARRPWVVGGVLAAVVLLATAALSTTWLWPRIEITSEPSGASILLDGRPAGRTPAVVRVEPGVPHRIELRRRGYRSVARQLVGQVSRGGSYDLAVQMRPAQTIHVSPAAVVRVNGEEVGRGERVELPTLPPGPVVVTAEAPGHRGYERRFSGPEAVPESWDVTLLPLP